MEDHDSHSSYCHKIKDVETFAGKETSETLEEKSKPEGCT